MAITTRNRRASILGVGLAGATVFPNPDGSISAQADRQHAAYVYAGIEAGTPYRLDPTARRTLTMARTERVVVRNW
jgi:hypothetical protein